MKKLTFTIGSIRKETPEVRKERVRNDTANVSRVFRNKKAYDRRKYKMAEKE